MISPECQTCGRPNTTLLDTKAGLVCWTCATPMDRACCPKVHTGWTAGHQQEESVVESQQRDRWLFGRIDRGEKRCALCGFVVAPGPYQHFRGFEHGLWHVRRGEAVKITSGSTSTFKIIDAVKPLEKEADVGTQ